VQAVFAKKQLLQEGGALMWEQLLVEATGFFPNGWQNEDDGFNDWTLSGDEWSVIAGTGDPILQTDILRINTFDAIPLTSEINIDVSITLPSLIDYNLALWFRNDPAGTWIQFIQGWFVPTELKFDRNLTVASTGAAYDAIGIKLGQRSGSDKTMIIRDIVINSSLPNVIETGKLLTKFENPIMWRGWERTVSYLIDPDIANRGLNFPLRTVLQIATVNKDLGGTTEVINIGSPPPVGVGAISISDLGGFYTVVRVTNTDTTENISEQIFYRIEDECRNPIMIEWINFDGGFDQHLFSISTIIEIEHDAGLVGERAITTNLENALLTKFRTVKRCTQRMVLTAEKLKLDQLLAMRDIKNSPLISVWLTKDGLERIFVIATNDFTTPYNSKNDLHDFSITIEFPTNFQFEEGKKY